MNHQQWLEWRRQGIGSSDAAAIMGVSPWKSRLQVWEDKVFAKTDEKDSSAMQRGRDLEEPARRCFEKKMDVSVFADNVIHPQTDWMRASLDGIDIDRKVLVEIKCPNKDDHLVAAAKKIPDKYFPQCQHQLLVTGLPGMYYFSYDGSDGVIVEVARDEAYIEKLVAEEKSFWQDVLDRIPPKPTEKDFADMQNNNEWARQVVLERELRLNLKDLEARYKASKERLISLASDRSARGHGLALTKAVCRGAIDYPSAISDYLENLRAHYPEISFPELPVEPYRKESFTKWMVKDID